MQWLPEIVQTSFVSLENLKRVNIYFHFCSFSKFSFWRWKMFFFLFCVCKRKPIHLKMFIGKLSFHSNAFQSTASYTDLKYISFYGAYFFICFSIFMMINFKRIKTKNSNQQIFEYLDFFNVVILVDLFNLWLRSLFWFGFSLNTFFLRTNRCDWNVSVLSRRLDSWASSRNWKNSVTWKSWSDIFLLEVLGDLVPSHKMSIFLKWKL